MPWVLWLYIHPFKMPWACRILLSHPSFHVAIAKMDLTWLENGRGASPWEYVRFWRLPLGTADFCRLTWSHTDASESRLKQLVRIDTTTGALYTSFPECKFRSSTVSLPVVLWSRSLVLLKLPQHALLEPWTFSLMYTTSEKLAFPLSPHVTFRLFGHFSVSSSLVSSWRGLVTCECQPAALRSGSYAVCVVFVARLTLSCLLKCVIRKLIPPYLIASKILENHIFQFFVGTVFKIGLV